MTSPDPAVDSPSAWTLLPLPELRGARVLVVGDVMLDEYLWGDVWRVSPEAPVPIVEVARRSAAPGGAGNAAAGVAALGGRAWLAGAVGDDPNASRLREALTSTGVHTDGVLTDAGRTTTTKARLLARGQHVVRMDAESRAPLTDGLAARLLSYVTAVVSAVDAVVLSDYAKGVLTPGVAQAVIDLARGAGKAVIADPAGTDYRKYRGATLLTPSVDEVETAVGRSIRTDGDLRAAGMRLAAQLASCQVLITRGALGMWLVSPSGIVMDIPARARSVYDITGAGDTVVAALAVALARGVALPVAIGLANAAAGIAVGKAGTACVSLAEVVAEAAGVASSADAVPGLRTGTGLDSARAVR